MPKVKVLDKGLKIMRPGMRCRFRDVTARTSCGDQLRMLVQEDTALIESLTSGEIRLKADHPILKTASEWKVEEGQQQFVFKTRYVERFKAWMASTNVKGIECFVELTE